MHRLSIYIVSAIMLLSTMSIAAQNLRLVRTDVDSSRSSFVTSTYIFAFDVIAEDVEKCNGVAFELHYDKTNYVKLSEWRVLDFGSDASAVVIPTVNAPSDEGIINVGILSGDDVNDAIYDNPAVIHLEFALAQSAPHGEDITFTFNNAQAVVRMDSNGAVLDLTGDPVIYNIHSFVEVWPGDANDDGVVNTKDVTNIALFMGLGSKSKSMRSFKRPSGSTLWSGQRVLSWDSAAATYADCDGNGDITPYDALIISLNYGKQQAGIIPKDNDQIQSNDGQLPDEPVFTGKGLLKIPLKTDYSVPYIGLSSVISLSGIPEGFEFIGLERGDLFDSDESFFLYDVKKNTVEMSFGSVNKVRNEGNPGIFAYMVLRSDKENAIEFIPDVEKLNAIDEYGNIFPLRLMTDVDHEEVNKGIYYNSTLDAIVIKSQVNKNRNITVYDIAGNRVFSKVTNSNIVYLTSLTNGYCLAEIIIDGKRKTISFIK